jgi:hypothetical protein
MNAVVQDTYGSPEVLQLREIDRPVVGDNQVLVRVRAAGVDPGVWHLMTGRPTWSASWAMGCARPRSASGAGTSPGGWRRSAPTCPSSAPVMRCSASARGPWPSTWVPERTSWPQAGQPHL